MPERIRFLYIDNEGQCITYFNWFITCACKQILCKKKKDALVIKNNQMFWKISARKKPMSYC